MGLRAGQTNNLNGRPKGSKNKTTERIRTTIENFIDTNINELQSSFDQLSPKEKIYFIEKLLKYVLPTVTPGISEPLTQGIDPDIKEAILKSLKPLAEEN